MVMVAVPLTTVHTPLPVVAVVAVNVVVVELHNTWSTPALAVDGAASTEITTSSVEAGQVPLLIVH